MSNAQILVVTSAAAPTGAAVAVLAAIEAAGLRVRALDIGGSGDGLSGVADRVRRALLGESADRRIRRELEVSPPDAAVAFDPDATAALTAARDQVQNPAPVIAVVAELTPGAAWAQTDADRFVAVDELAAVALADAGVDGDRILVVGAIGERAFAEAAAHDRAALRQRFKLAGKVALVEVAGLGGELTGQLAMQLSLLDAGDQLAFLFDAAGDAESAAVLRRQVPALGLRGKLFGQTAEAALLWRVADVVVARPRPEVVSRVMLAGAKLVAIIDDAVPSAAAITTALELRKRALPAAGLLLLASALDAAFAAPAPAPTADGGDNVADIVAAVAGDRRAVIDERRAIATAATRDRVRAASAAASAAAAVSSAPGELEDLGGAPAVGEPAGPVIDRDELARLRAEVDARVRELGKSMMTARQAAADLDAQARAATGDDVAAFTRRADGERARMHALLGELATLQRELGELDAQIKAAGAARPRGPAAPKSSWATGDDLSAAPPPPKVSIDDALDALKKKAGGPASPPPKATAARLAPGAASAPPASRPSRGAPADVDDELAALKKKMANAPPKKK